VTLLDTPKIKSKVRNIKPGVKYIYERNGEEIYAREVGKSQRTMIGKYTDPFNENLTINYELENTWKDILKESRTNPTLQEAMERVKILYHLSKDHGQK
jgi:hypothetical protein